MLTPDSFVTNQSDVCPQADHPLFLEHSKTPEYPLQGRHTALTLRSLASLRLLLPGKAIVLFLSTSPKTVSKVNQAPVNSGQILAAIIKTAFSFLLFSHSVMSDSATPWTAACQASLSITNSQSLLKLMSIESVMPSNHLQTHVH